ncbi:MAG: hypothetical protein AAFO99_10425 [Bacteroidota bacterium]
MEIKLPDTSSVKNLDNNAYILRMERNNRDLVQLGKKLNSYVCEPKTYGLFERIELLRNKLEKLKDTNYEIMVSLRGHKKILDDQLNRIKQQFLEFKELEKSVTEYMAGARSC